MLLATFKAQTTTDPHKILATALQAYAEQVFTKIPTDVNKALQTHSALVDYKDKQLTISQLWQGEKWKGERPQDYTHAIVAAAVIPGSYRKTAYGETYDRLSIQPSWLSGQLVIVKEETHADDVQKKMIFLGKEITDLPQAKQLLINALLEEHFTQHSAKTEKILGSMQKAQAQGFLNDHFEKLFLNEQPPLFHVEHGIQGEEDTPIETWKLVRLAPPAKTIADIKAVADLKERIANAISSKLYMQTLHMLDKKQYGPR